MAGPDSEVRISTRLDNSKLNNDFRGTANKMKQLSGEFKNTNKFIQDTQKELDKAKESYRSLVDAEKEKIGQQYIEAKKNLDHYIEAQEKLNGLTAKSKKEVSALEDTYLRQKEILDKEIISGTLPTQDIEAMEKRVDALRKEWINASKERSKYIELSRMVGGEAEKQAGEEVQRLGSLLAKSAESFSLNSDEAQELNARIKALGGELDRARGHADGLRQKINFRQAIETFQAAGEKAKELSQKIASIGVSAAKSLGSLVSHANSGIKSLAGMVTGLMRVNRHSRYASNGIQKFGSRLVKLAKNVFVFSLITRGLREIRQGITDLMKTNSDMAASLNAIQVHLLVAFAPIWEYIQPGLVTFLAVLERATAAIATFFAMLGGKTYEQAKAAAAALYEQIKALRETGKEADKAGKKLAGFDKVNKLAQETTEDGAGLDFGAVEFPDFAWLDELRSIIGDWYEVGEFLSGKLTNFLENIDWGSIKASAQKLATNIVGFINGFLDDPTLWIAVGRTIAEGLNTALTFLNTLLSGLHWETFGRNFGAMLNTIVREIDWILLGKTMADGVNAVFGFLLRAIETFDWAYLGAMLAAGLLSMTNTVKWDYIALTLSLGLNGALLTLYTFLTSYPWGDLGATLASMLNLMVTTINWAAIGATIAALFNSAISFLYRAVTDFRWSELGSGLAQAINKLIHGIRWAELGRTFSNFFKGILDTIHTAVREMDWAGVGKSIGEFFANIDWKAVFEKVGQIIGTVLGGIFATIWAALGNDVKDVEKAFQGLMDWLERNREAIGKVVEIALVLIATFGVVAPLIKSIATLFAFLASPIGSATVAITALVAAIAVVASAWNKLSAGEKILAALGVAAIAAAAAIAIFHTSWTAGLAAAAIALGIAGIIAIFSAVKSQFGSSANFSSMGSFTSGLSSVQAGTPSMPSSAASLFAQTSRGSPLPQLARGGIVDQATVAMIGERGKEAVVPLENNTEWMDTLADKLALRMNVNNSGGQPQSINIIAEGDVGKIIRFFKFELDREDRRQGMQMSSKGLQTI